MLMRRRSLLRLATKLLIECQSIRLRQSIRERRGGTALKVKFRCVSKSIEKVDREELR